MERSAPEMRFVPAAGFICQVNTTIARWLALKDGEILELERGEDIDVVYGDVSEEGMNVDRVLEQIKRRTTKALTLKSPEAIEAIAHFAEHRRANPSLRLQFRYITTAPVGVERDWPDETGGIATWEALRRGDMTPDDRQMALDKIRNFLAKRTCPERTRDSWKYVENVLGRSSLANLIETFEWSTSPDYPEIEEQAIKRS